MRTIKRYSNRKLYDTEAKKYVTLDQLADIIRTGDDIQVIDNDSGQDLTTVTLSQILVEQEKKREGIFPRSFLSDLISGRSPMVGRVRKAVSGLMSGMVVAEESIERNIEQLIKQGEMGPEEGNKLKKDILKKTRKTWESVDNLIEEKVTDFLSRLNIPRKSDLNSLAERLEGLIDRFEAYQKGQSKTKPTPKKKTSKTAG